MKKVLFLMLVLVSFKTKAQSSAAEQAANRMAQRVADSLHLTSSQKAGLYKINLSLNNQKLAAKQQPAADALRQQLQLIESKRDSLYRSVLTDQQFQQYTQRKASILGYNRL